MTGIMKSCVVALAILFLWRVEDGAEACTCLNISPKDKICRADVVIRASVYGRQEVESIDSLGNIIKSTRYDISVIQMFKGPSGGIDAVYTSSPCRAYLQSDDEDYLITGRLEADGTVHIILCNFINLWDDLSTDQLNLLQDYVNSCS